MKYSVKTIKEFDMAAVDMDYHFQTARKLRSAEAHLIVKNILKALTPSLSDIKTRYVLALTRTA